MQIQYEEILRIVTAYIIPILSFIFSGIALYHSNKSRQTEEKLKNFELYIKEHEAKQIESLQNIPSNPNIEARVYKIFRLHRGYARPAAVFPHPRGLQERPDAA